MGAQQSSETNDASIYASPAKTCYYELLEVNEDATDDDIKKAYRRKALELHPDRNLNNIDIATQKFAEVQSAYEILSDPQERAWYDSHRDAILTGRDATGDEAKPTTFRNVRLTSTEEILGLVRQFNASVNFDDEPAGFFSVVRKTFEHLALEEEAATISTNDSEYVTPPTFGSSKDSYEAVVKPFYAAWAGFSTKKSFSWKDKYRLSDAPDRRVRRWMEKENKKIRDDSIREFNEAVNFLVSFVRKRDPRYLPLKSTEAERQRMMRDATAAQAARARAAHQEKTASFDMPEWAKAQEDGPELAEFSSTSEESEIEVLECIVCNKTFKSENQLEAHERSKKHIKALQVLQRQMKKEGHDLGLGQGINRPKVPSPPPTKENTVAPSKLSDITSQVESMSLNEGGSSEPLDQSSVDEAKPNSDSPTDEDYAPRDAVENRLASEPDLLSASRSNEEHPGESSHGNENQPAKKLGKAKAKREKRAVAMFMKQDNGHRCLTCNDPFPSRQKLFDHIKDQGHAAPISVSGSQRASHSKKPKKKSRT